MGDVDPHPPLACSDVNHGSAFGSARAIAAGHSIVCARFGLSQSCPMRTGEAATTPPPLGAVLLAMGEALERGRMAR